MTTHALRLNSPGELIATTPFILGFHPADSVVVLCIHDSRLGLIQRLDLPPSDLHGAGVVQALLPALLAERPDAVLLIGYEASVGQSLSAIAALSLALLSEDIPVKDRLVVHAGRWRSVDCDNPDCCPAAGSSVPRPADLPGLASPVCRAPRSGKCVVGHGAGRRHEGEADSPTGIPEDGHEDLASPLP